jgi:hypothetical protein
MERLDETDVADKKRILKSENHINLWLNGSWMFIFYMNFIIKIDMRPQIATHKYLDEKQEETRYVKVSEKRLYKIHY